MELRHLVLLRELADHGSVSAVADVRRVTTSAVSQQLRTAERDLGARLIEPHGRGVRLTAAGAMLAEAAVDVATAMAIAQRRWNEFSGQVGGLVTVAILPSAGVLLLPRLLAGLAGSGVQITVHDHDVSEDDYAALTRDHDLVVGHRMSAEPPTAWQRLRRVDLFREPLDVAVPTGHRLADRASVRAEDLAGEDWIGVPQGYPFDALRLTLQEQAGGPLRVVQRVLDNRVAAALVASGHGIGLLPRFSSRHEPGVVLLPLVGTLAGRVISALARPDAAERAVVRHVVAGLQDAVAAVQSPD